MSIMDLPSIKSTWTAKLRASTEITNVYMSAVTISKSNKDNYNIYNFT